jgi:hypothetical protein
MIIERGCDGEKYMKDESTDRYTTSRQFLKPTAQDVGSGGEALEF